MRLDEFANAEDQMALWKLINDNVWQAIESQRQQQAREAQAKAAKAKLKPRKGRKGASPKISIPSMGPKPPPPKKPMALSNPQQVKTQPPHRVTQAQQLATRQQGVQPSPTSLPTAPVNASLAPKDGVFAPDIAQKNSELRGDDRHSKNGYPPPSQVTRVVPKAPARVGSYTK
jgi:hypothetical protein